MTTSEYINWTGLILIVIAFSALAITQIKMMFKHGVVSSMYNKLEGLDRKVFKCALGILVIGLACFFISPLF